MSRLNLPSFVILFALVCATAAAQTKEQCTTIGSALPKITLGVGSAEKALTEFDWKIITSNTSGKIKGAAEMASQAQVDLLVAMRKYKIALEDVTYQANLCAR